MKRTTLSERAVIFAPRGRDSAIAAAILAEAGFEATSCSSLPDLVAELDTGAAFTVVTEEALVHADLSALAAWLGDQEQWSDLPFVLLTTGGGGLERNPAARRFLDILGNVTFLERPFHPTTLVSLARSALRARRRQYEARARLEALRESEARLSALVETLPVGVGVVDMRGQLLLFNSEMRRFLPTGLIPSQDPQRLHRWRAWTADGGVLNVRDFPGMRALRGERVVPGVEMLYTEDDGQDVWTRVATVPVTDALGQVTGQVIAISDIDTLKRTSEALRDLNETLERRVAERTRELAESERRFRGIFDSALQFMALLKPDGTVVEVNETALEWSRIDASVMIGQPFWAAPPMRGDEALQSAIREGVRRAARGETVREEFEMRGAGEVRATIDFSLKPVRGENGEAIWLVAEGRDVTDLKSAQEALRQSQKLEAVGQLTGGVAHDFNNLLTIIRSSTDLLRRPDLAETRRRRYVDAISDTVDRAAKLTGQLLAFARRQALKPEVFDVRERVGAVTDMLRTVVGSRIELKVDAGAGVCFVEADLSQFETALVNLAVNARDAMDGEGTLTVTVRDLAGLPPLRGHAAASGPFVAVSVADTGTGIPQDRILQIFEPFYTTKEIGKGTGLGLSQVYGFVKQSGGDVSVESAAGQGAVFTLYLPRVEHRRSEPTTHAPLAGADVEGRGRRVLVVEDNVEVGRFSTQLLQDLGYETTWVANAAEALERLGEPGRFDVVFSDVVMPGLGGVELGEEIRRRHPGLPVVLTSGYSHVLAEEGRHGFELLQKPYAAEELSRILRRVTRVPRGEPSG